MDIREWIAVFWKRKGVIVGCIATALLFGALYAFVIEKPTYEATSKILVQQPPRVVMLTEQSQHMTSPLSVDTQRRLLDSLPVAKKAAVILSRERSGGSSKLSDDEIINIGEQLLARVTSESDENTGIIRVKTKGENPQECAEIVNAYSKAFEEISREMMEKSFQDTMTYLQRQLKSAGEELTKKEKLIYEYSEKNGFVDLSAELAEKNNAIMSLEVKKIESQILEQELEAQLNSYQDIIRDKTIRLTQDPKDLSGNAAASIDTLNNSIIELEVKKSILLNQYKENHPEVIAINKQIDGYNKEIESLAAKIISHRSIDSQKYTEERDSIQSLNVQHLVVKLRVANLEKFIEKMDEEQKVYPKIQYEMNRLSREKLVAEKMYLLLYEQYQQAKIEEVKRDIDIQVFEKASAPKTPISPNRPNIIIISLILGTFAGVGLTIVLEEMEETIRTSDDVKNFLNLPVLGSVPYSTETINKLITDVPLKSPIAEAYRRLSFFTQLFCLDPPVKSLLVTSSKSDEGKSTTLSNLAISMAQEGTKVLIVDSDLRRPMLHRMFGVDNSLGISSILSGELEAQIAVSDLSMSGNLPKDSFMEVVVDRLIQPTSIKGLSIIPSGPLPANSIELIRSEKMLSFLRCIEKKADIVIFDSPPAIHVIDSVVLAQILDGVLFVINSGRITKTEAIQVKYMIESTKTPIIGVTLNNIEASSPDYYYYYYYGGYGYGSRQRRKRVKLKR